MAKKKHHKGHHYTGPIHHSDMTSHPYGVPGHDKHAHESHKKGSKEHGMMAGMGHVEEECDEGQHDGEGMAGNCSHEEG